MDITLISAAVAVCAVLVAVIAVRVSYHFSKENQQLHRRLYGVRARGYRPFTPPKSAEQERAEHLAAQLAAVTRAQVTFRRRRVMNGGEFAVFRAGMAVTGQPYPTGPLGFWIFPQVSLGQIIGTEGAQELADEAHRAINSKRCDLLIADRNGTPIAVLEYQGAGHNIGGTAERRDEIKRIALERAGVRYVEITDGTAPGAMQRIIRDMLTQQPPARKTEAGQTPA